MLQMKSKLVKPTKKRPPPGYSGKRRKNYNRVTRRLQAAWNKHVQNLDGGDLRHRLEARSQPQRDPRASNAQLPKKRPLKAKKERPNLKPREATGAEGRRQQRTPPRPPAVCPPTAREEPVRATSSGSRSGKEETPARLEAVCPTVVETNPPGKETSNRLGKEDGAAATSLEDEELVMTVSPQDLEGMELDSPKKSQVPSTSADPRWKELRRTLRSMKKSWKVGGVQLDKAVVERFLSPGDTDGWLCDTGIDAALEVIVEEVSRSGSGPSIVAMPAGVVSSCLVKDVAGSSGAERRAGNIMTLYFSCEVTLIPVNHGAHWYLVTVRHRPQTKRHRASYNLCVYNSLGKAGDEAGVRIRLKDLIERFRQTFTRAKINVKMETLVDPQQENAYDCGMFVIVAARCLAMGRPLQFGQSDVTEARLWWAQRMMTEDKA